MNDRPRRILVDMDEVLVEFVEALLDAWYEESGQELIREQVTNWELSDLFGERGKEWVRETLSIPYFFAEMQPKPGAIRAMEYLRDNGDDVLIVTHVSPHTRNVFDGKRDWLRQHLPWFDLKRLCFMSLKERIEGDMLIDDAPHNIRNWMRAGKNGAIVFDAPWNREKDLVDSCMPSILDRITGWHEFLEMEDRRRAIEDALRRASEAHRNLPIGRGGLIHPSLPRTPPRDSEGEP